MLVCDKNCFQNVRTVNHFFEMMVFKKSKTQSLDGMKSKAQMSNTHDSFLKDGCVKLDYLVCLKLFQVCPIHFKTIICYKLVIAPFSKYKSDRLPKLNWSKHYFKSVASDRILN